MYMNFWREFIRTNMAAETGDENLVDVGDPDEGPSGSTDKNGPLRLQSCL